MGHFANFAHVSGLCMFWWRWLSKVLSHSLLIKTAPLVTAAGTVTAHSVDHSIAWPAHVPRDMLGDEPALTLCLCGKHTKIPKHSCLRLEQLPSVKGFTVSSPLHLRSLPFTAFKTKPVSTKLTNKTINFYILRNETERLKYASF